jgi:O-antigen/teichoic acid export membrane protein
VTGAGVYLSVLFGFLGMLLVARQLEPEDFGLFAIVVVATGFFQALFDLTAEEALVKYGFDYAAGESWGRLRQLFRRALVVKFAGGVLAGVLLVALAPIADSIFGASGLTVPLLLAAPLPVLQSPEGVSSAALITRGRYDVRSWLSATSMAFRMVGLAVGAHFGVNEAVAGFVLAQGVATVVLGAFALNAFRRFPTAPPEPLGEDRRGIVRFVVHSSLATGVVSLRAAVAPLLLGVVSNPVQVGYFRIAQAPQQGLTSLSAPARLILLTEQTRDWAHGAKARVFAGVRRYTAAAALLMLLIVPPLYIFLPALIRLLYGDDYSGAAAAARIVLGAAAIQVVFGWTKSFPVSIGRPNLRVLTHGIETIVLLPLILALAPSYGAEGAAVAVLVASIFFALTWIWLFSRIVRATLHPRRAS